MIIKMLITFDFDPETNEYTPIGQEIVKSDKPKTVKVVEEEDTCKEPQLTLEVNKYTLNNAAIETLQVEVGDRIDVRFCPISTGGALFPIIGSAESWKGTTGNKLTKSKTVSWRGKSNELLASFGDTFAFNPWQGHDGLYVLIGNKDREPEQLDDNVVITESPEPAEDIVEPEDLSYSLEDDVDDSPTELDDETFNL